MASTFEPDVRPSHPLSMGSGDRASDWLQANGRLVGVGVGLLLAAGLGGIVWRSSERSKAERAERALFEAQGAAAGGAPQAERALRPLVTRYAGTAGGAQAALLLAQSLYDQGKYQDGLSVLERAKVPDEFRDGARLLRAAGLEGANRPAEAARIYEELARQDGLPARRRDELRGAAARAYQLANDRAAARRLWQQVLTDNASPLVDEARVRVGELSAA